MGVLNEIFSSQILSHTAKKPLILLGHSLGGMLARLIGIQLLDDDLLSTSSVNVIMFDSWTLGTDNLNLERMKEYIEVYQFVKLLQKNKHLKFQSQFKSIPDGENLVKTSIFLSTLLKEHKFVFDPRVGIFSFKAAELTETPLRRAIL